MGINLGARIGPLVTGWLQESSGFHWGFGAAAIGMALGLGIYAQGRNKLPEETHRVPNPLPSAQRSRYGLIFLGIAVVIAVFHTQMVALFFLSVSLGTALAGILAGLYNPADELPYFLGVGGTAVVIAVALAAGSPAIKKLMGGVR